MRHSLLRFAILAALSMMIIAVTLAAMELSIRLLAPQQLVILRPDLHVSDNGLGYDRRPNLNTLVNTGEREIRLMTDAHGHRIGTNRRSVPVCRVLALGDSFLEALAVDHQDIMTTKLERSLSSALKRPVEIVNAGVGGHNPNHYLIRAKRELSNSRYDMVIVFVFLGNDIEFERIGWFPPRSQTSRHKIQLPTSLSWQEWKFKVFYPINDFSEERFHLFQLAKYRMRVMLAWLGLTSYYFPEVMKSYMADSFVWSTTASILEDIADQAASQTTATVFVLLPTVYQVEEEQFHEYIQYFSIDPSTTDLYQPNRLLSAEMERRGLSVIDTTAALRAARAAGRKELYGRRDHHFAPGGHQVVADVLQRYLLADGRLCKTGQGFTITNNVLGYRATSKRQARSAKDLHP